MYSLPSRFKRHAACLLLSTAAFGQTPANQPAPTQPQDHPTAVQAAAAQATPSDAPPISTRLRRDAEDAYLAGARQLDRDDPVAAEKSFAHAVQLNPGNRDYALAQTVAREHHITQLVQQAGKQRVLGNTALADALLAQARTLDPQNTIVTQHFAAATDQAHPPIPQLDGAIELTPRPITQSFHLRTDTQTLLTQIATAYGLHPLFDSSVTHQTVRLDLDDTPYAQVMPLALRMTHVFAVPLDPTTLLLVNDTEENRQRYQSQLLETLNLPGETPEQLADVAGLLRNVFELKQIAVEPLHGNITIRAPADTLHAINLTLGDIFDGGSQVMIDMQLYELDTTRTRNLGAQLPQSFGAYNVVSTAQSAIAANQTVINQAIASGALVLNGNSVQNLAKEAIFLAAAGLLSGTQLTSTLGFFGGGITTTGVFLGSGATLNLALNSSDSRILDDIQLRAGDRQEAVFRTGTRYPITTSIYSSSVPTLPSSLAGATINGVSVSSLLSQYATAATSIPQIQYEDLGLTLKATPLIQKNGSITLKLDMKIESLSGASINTLPILGSRVLTSVVTVDDGTTAMLVSNVSHTESAAVSGIPGLSELPGFQATTNDDAELDTGRLVILLTPHIIRRRHDTLVGPRIAMMPPPPGTPSE